MIGNWLGTITPEMEERLLTCSLRNEHREDWVPFTGDGCLLQVAYATKFWQDHSPGIPAFSFRWKSQGHALYLWDQYDRLRMRFPSERVQHAIRMRVLRNQLRRALNAAKARQTVAA